MSPIDPATPVPPHADRSDPADEDEALIAEDLVEVGVEEAESELREEVEDAYFEEAASGDDREAELEDLASLPNPEAAPGSGAPELGALRLEDGPDET